MWSLKVDNQDINFDIKFTFRHLRDLNYYDGATGHMITDSTMCDLIINDTPFWGLALCSESDTFNKETGRKLALARAIQDARDDIDLPWEVRDKIWATYFNRSARSEVKIIPVDPVSFGEAHV